MGKTVTSLTAVKTKNGISAKGPWLLSIFSAADGREYSTFKGELASKANSLIGQTVEVEYSEKQNGQFTNYTLEDVAAAGAGEVAVVVDTPVGKANPEGEFRRSKEQVMRAEALQATLTLFGIIGLDPLSGVDEFEGWFNSLYKLIEAGVFETPDVRVEA